jgi:hypothetical protein
MTDSLPARELYLVQDIWHAGDRLRAMTPDGLRELRSAAEALLFFIDDERARRGVTVPSCASAAVETGPLRVADRRRDPAGRRDLGGGQPKGGATVPAAGSGDTGNGAGADTAV